MSFVVDKHNMDTWLFEKRFACQVTPSFAQLLLNQAWVRERYWSSCGDVEIVSKLEKFWKNILTPQNLT